MVQEISAKTQISKMNDDELASLFTKKELAEFYSEALNQLQIEYENYQKRTEKDLRISYKYTSQNIIKELLKQLDILEKAIKYEENINSNLTNNLSAIVKTFYEILQGYGVTPIEAIGKPFDPKCHEAMFTKITKDYPDMTVVEELEKGFILYDRVLIPSKVIVSQTATSDYITT